MFEVIKMSVRVKLRADKKTMIKFGDKLEEMWFIDLMRSIRDSDSKTHPVISIRDKNGEIPRLPPPKIVPQGKDGKPIPPEILEKMKIEKVKVEKKINEVKK